jgi:hypothetical protein
VQFKSCSEFREILQEDATCRLTNKLYLPSTQSIKLDMPNTLGRELTFNYWSQLYPVLAYSLPSPSPSPPYLSSLSLYEMLLQSPMQQMLSLIHAISLKARERGQRRGRII